MGSHLSGAGAVCIGHFAFDPFILIVSAVVKDVYQPQYYASDDVVLRGVLMTLSRRLLTFILQIMEMLQSKLCRKRAVMVQFGVRKLQKQYHIHYFTHA